MTSTNNEHNYPAPDFENTIATMDYDAQFYGFSPYTIFEALKMKVRDYICFYQKKFSEVVFKHMRPDEVSMCDEISEKIIKKFETVIEKVFRKYESKFLSVFKIPPNVLLPEDEVQTKQYTEEDMEQIDAEIAELENRYKRALCMEAFLDQEIEESKILNSVEKKVAELEDDVKTLSQKFDSKLKSWNEDREMLEELNALCSKIEKLTSQF